MRETQAQIKKYQARLPHMREKLAMVAMMFVMSIVMLTSATFAWIVLSTSPEVTGISTTVVSNGSLEIALSDKDGKEPDEAMVGDSVKEIVSRNITWGNLVNLSDASYGLGEIILRPAALNTSSLTESPLFAADYTSDGRIEGLKSDFAFSNYDTNTKMFLVPASTEYGVRAVSSVTYTFAGGQEIFVERLQSANNALSLAKTQYQTLTSDNDNMTAISSMMGDYLSDQFGGTTTDYQKYIPQVYSMVEELNTCLNTTGEAIVYIANLQLMLTQGGSATFYTLDTLLKESAATLPEGVQIEGFDSFISDYEKFQNHRTNLKSIYDDVKANGTTVKWSQLEAIVNFIVHVDSTKVDGIEVKDIGMDEAASLIFKSDHKAIIYKGLLYNLEKLLGTNMYAEDLPVKVSYKGMNPTLYADIFTDAKEPFYLPTTINTISNSNSGSFKGTDPVAADTYGMAVDVWVRTNAVDDYLILEGNVLTEQVQQKDTQGNLYFTDPESEEVVIKATNGKFYDEDGKELTGVVEEELEITYITIVSGYEGENRVWDSSLLTTSSTTQGEGSCYIFYSDSPAAQTQSLETLAAMTVVFIDEKGKLLAYADMDVESHYAEAGRVTVPLKLRSNSLNVGTNEAGENMYAICPLEQGQAKRITALVYVDGTKLENMDVLADADIQGKLNIQFGTLGDLNALVDEGIFYDEIHISGTAAPNEFDFETITGVDDLKSTITLTIMGAEPEKVTANFTRKINATQGSRQEAITFKSNGDGTYTGIMPFTSPGTYVMRTVEIDGVDYELDAPITVNISGFAIGSVGWKYASNYVTVLSADNTQSENISVTFGGALQPSKVQGIFANDNNQQINVSFKKGTTGWTGTAKFTTSGIYDMEYLLVDGEYYEIPTSMKKTLNLSLGMQAAVTIPNSSFEFDGTEVTLPVYVTVKDDKGNELKELENVSLQYMFQSSGLVENGLYTSLSWNSATERYEGNFTVETAGAYQFGYLQIGNGSITSATAPVITAIPPIPPAYYVNLTEENIFAYGGNVYMRIAMTDAKAIANGNIIAIVEKLNDNGSVEGTITIPGTSAAHSNGANDDLNADINDWVFQIPTTEELKNMECLEEGVRISSQLGTWRMTTLKIIGAYLDGEITTEEEPMVIDVSSEGIQTFIDDEMSVVVNYYGDATVNNGEALFTLYSGLFLDSATTDEGLVVQIRGAGGEFVSYEEDATGKPNMTVSATYAWDKTSITTSGGSTSAGYSVDAGVLASMENQGIIKSDLVLDGSDTTKTKFLLDKEKPMVLPFEGKYKLQSIEFTINGTTYKTNATEGAIPFSTDSVKPVYSYTWQAPVVKVTGVSPEGEVTVNTGSGSNLGNGASVEGKRTNSYTAYSATVHLKASITTTTETDSCSGDTTTKTKLNGYSLPTVTTAISNINNFYEASIFIDGNDDNTDVTFAYTSSSKQSVQTIGGCNNVYIGWDRYTMGSDKKATHISITGVLDNTTIKYIFELVNPITINNPL